MAESARVFSVSPAFGAHFVLVEGRFYEALNDKLIAGARRAIEAAGASCTVVTLPGALEIPVAIEILRQSGRKIDGFVALGVVIRGETTHYEIVSQESARALLDLATRHALALGNGILTVETHEQAEKRADPNQMDKGGDAARAALALYALNQAKAAATGGSQA